MVKRKTEVMKMAGRIKRWVRRVAVAVAGMGTAGACLVAAVLPSGMEFVRGPVNGVLIERDGHRLAVYGDPRGGFARADTVLFTHHRRDVVWAGRGLVEAGAAAIVPAAEAGSFTNVAAYWAGWRQQRFHDYAQQSSKVLTRPLSVTHGVQGGEIFDWHGLDIEVLDTPGYTRGAVSYLISVGGKTVVFTGDLIVGDGQLPDLYSLQDAIPEAGIRGYHGWAARLGAVVTSLETIAAEQPDFLVPAHGPVIDDPAAAIERLLDRIRAVYANYLSIDALRWYFGDDHIRVKARRVLGPDAQVDWMPMAATVREALPDWITPINNTRLIRAADGAGLLIDCGSRGILNQLKQLRADGALASLDQIFITHYHDDHTDAVPEMVREFGATVLACPEMIDVLERPAAYRLPAMTAHPIPVTARIRSGATWRWKEFQLTLHYFPGQTLFHQALLVQKDGGESVCFIGDSFTPSGIDDYCLQNRDFLHPGMGYFYCLDLLEQLPPDCLLINQHVKPAFRFSPAQIARMRATLRERLELLRPLTPWNDPNFALDAGWARFRPYAVSATPGGTVRGAVVLFNHAATTREFRVKLNPPAGWRLVEQSPLPLHVPPRQEGVVHFQLRLPAEASSGLTVLTADVRNGGRELRQWCELLVEVEHR